MSTSTSGEFFLIRRVASNPSNSGSSRSSTAISGFNSAASLTASRPSPASPHTRQSLRASNIVRKPLRTTSWSSASRIRTDAVFTNFLLTKPMQVNRSSSKWRHTRNQQGAGRIGLDFHGSAELPEALPHAGDSNSQPCLAFQRAGPGATILYLQNDFSISIFERHRCCFAARVAHNVGEPFLNYTKQVGFQVVRQASDLIFHVELNIHTASLGKPVDIPPHRHNQPNLVECGRMK